MSQEPSEEAARFLAELRGRHSADEVIAALGGLRDQRVLVIGDAIVDEYHFCRPYGMPLKSPIIAAQALSLESYAGGVLAVANHVANFVNQVHLFTGLGEIDSREDFIRENLSPRVRPEFFVRPAAPTIVKRRYLQRFLLQKLFEIAFFDDRPLPEAVEAQLLDRLRAVVADYDVVIVADFGHGFITPAVAALLSEKARFLAVNTQLNSINFGYNVITKYARIDYACIDEEETRLACRDRFGPVEAMLPGLAERLGCQMMTVTRGHHGSLTWRRGGELAHTPVLSREVVDTIGAGDAFLSIAALCAQRQLSPELIGLIGNSVGALAVRIVGNASSIDEEGLVRFIRQTLGDP